MDKFFRLMASLVMILVTSSCAVQEPSSSETRGEIPQQGQVRVQGVEEIIDYRM